MLSTISISANEESDATTSVVVQDHSEIATRGLVDDALANGPVENELTREDLSERAVEQPDEPAPPEAPASPYSQDVAARLRALLSSVAEVEQLSRQAREAAASDLAHYDTLVDARQVLEHHRREASDIRQRAEQLTDNAFGQLARAFAVSTLTEAREVEQAVSDLVEQRSVEVTAFQADHPDVEALVQERRHQAAETRRRELEAERARRLADLLQAGELAVRQGALRDAQECLRLLKAEFPMEEDRIEALRSRIQQRVQAARDAAARAALGQVAEHQGRGDLEAAVTVLEQVDVRGLSLEVGEDVFGAWSQACSRLAQSTGFDQGPGGSRHTALLRFSPAKGRGLILMADPAVPNGLVVFSALGMGPGYSRPRDTGEKVVSDPFIVERARGFRRATPLAQVGGDQSYARWQSYVTPAAVERH
jgi:hypothetical protein